MVHAHAGDGIEIHMPSPNSTWLINDEGMKRCCYFALRREGYRRADAQEVLMAQGQILKCSTCGSEMICETGNSGRLRWGMKKARYRLSKG